MRSLYEAINDSDEKVLDNTNDSPIMWLSNTFGCNGDEIQDLKDNVFSITIKSKKVVFDDNHGYENMIFSMRGLYTRPRIIVYNANAFYKLFRWPDKYGIDSDLTIEYDTNEDLSPYNIPYCEGTIVIRRCKSFTFRQRDTIHGDLILHKKNIGKIYGIDGFEKMKTLTIK